MDLSPRVTNLWLDRLAVSWGAEAAGAARSATADVPEGGDLVEVLEALADRGARAGVGLDTVFDWVEQLAQLSRPVRRELRTDPLWAALATRWASAQSDIGAPGGFAPFGALRSRLRGHYLLSERLGLPPEDSVVLVVLSYSQADAAWAEAAVRRFLPQAIITAATACGHLVALVDRDRWTLDTVEAITDEARGDGHSTVHVRTEPLAPTRVLLDAHLDQLDRTA